MKLMAKIVELKERDTSEVMYPVTTVDCVIDDTGKSLTDIIKESLNGSYSITFTEGTVALEFSPNKSIKITSYQIQNIETVNVTAGAINLTLANNLIIPANTLVTWEITKTSDHLPALIGINFEYYEN